ncbi:MAG: DNA primase [Candidatus Magasanikbacteria bacterium]
MTDVSTIKDRIDIVQLLGEYIQVKKAGANYKARCPFHNEKTPSFMIHPDKQIWHCFGCGKGGDVFTFIQEIEGLDFPEALKLLAERAGVKLDNFRSEIDKSQKNRILDVNKAAVIFFHRFLLEMNAALSARAYLDRRGLKKETIAQWQIGFIPDQWELLTQYLIKKGFGVDDLVAAGLTIRKENAPAGKGFYDRFRGRIMFPIWDAHGNVVGFTGRVLVETDHSGGKYVNTPQTSAYDKSRVIYGLDKAKMEIKSSDLAVIVEGQMDVIACHQAGMKNVIASSGTALTAEQVKLIKRYTNNVAVAFDADSAGQEAAKRGIAVALEEGLNVRVISIPTGAGKDADECIKINSSVWFDAVKNADGVMEWYFAGTLSKYNKHDPIQKQKAAEILLAEILRIPHVVERDDWLKKLSNELDIDTAVLREESKKIIADKIKHVGFKPEQKPAAKIENKDKMTMIGDALMALMLKFPAVFGWLVGQLKSEYLSPQHQALYDLVSKQYNTKVIDVSELEKQYQKISTDGLLDILLLQAEKDFCDFTDEQARKEAVDLVNQAKIEWTKKRRQTIQKELEKAEKMPDKEQLDGLLNELQNL